MRSVLSDYVDAAYFLLFDNNGEPKRHITARDIAVKHMNGGAQKKGISKAMVEEISTKLPTIKRRIEMIGQLVAPVNERYVCKWEEKNRASFRLKEVQTLEEGRYVVWLGRGMKVHGLVRCDREDDPLYKAYQERVRTLNDGATGREYDRLASSVKQGATSIKDAIDIVKKKDAIISVSRDKVNEAIEFRGTSQSRWRQVSSPLADDDSEKTGVSP